MYWHIVSISTTYTVRDTFINAQLPPAFENSMEKLHLNTAFYARHVADTLIKNYETLRFYKVT